MRQRLEDSDDAPLFQCLPVLGILAIVALQQIVGLRDAMEQTFRVPLAFVPLSCRRK